MGKADLHLESLLMLRFMKIMVSFAAQSSSLCVSPTIYRRLDLYLTFYLIGFRERLLGFVSLLRPISSAIGIGVFEGFFYLGAARILAIWLIPLGKTSLKSSPCRAAPPLTIDRHCFRSLMISWLNYQASPCFRSANPSRSSCAPLQRDVHRRLGHRFLFLCSFAHSFIGQYLAIMAQVWAEFLSVYIAPRILELECINCHF